MKISIISSICLISLLVFIPQRTVRSCAWSPDEDALGYNFFDQKVMGESSFFPFLFTWHSFYQASDTTESDPVIDEWMTYFNNIPLRDDVEKVIYTIPVGSLSKCASLIEGGKAKLPDSLSSNSCLAYVNTTKDFEFIRYLLFARRCQPNVSWDDYWSTPEFKTDSLQNLSKEATALYQKSTNSFIRLKYAFQLVRLAHYAGKYDDCIILYNSLIEPMKEKSYTRYRALAHKAGAYTSKGLEVKASYYFACVFRYCPAMRIVALDGFSIKDESDFEELFKLCKDDSERATIFAMRSIQPYAKSMDDMKKIYVIDPTSDYNELLLVREVKMFENQFFGTEIASNEKYTNLSSDNTELFYDTAYFNEFKIFVGNVIRENKVKKSELWKLAAGYLAVYSGDFKEAERLLKDLKNIEIRDSRIKKSMILLQIGLDIRKLNTVDETEIERIYQEFKDSKIATEAQPDIYSSYPDNQFRYFLDKLQWLYKKNNNNLKSFLCNSDFETLLWSPDLGIINSLLELMNKKSKKPFETYLSLKAGSKNELLEMKGTLLLASGKQEEAVKIFKSIPTDFLQVYLRFYINANPFAANLHDCLSCDDSIVENSDYVKQHCITKLQFAEKIINLKKLANDKGENAAEINFQLGNAFYNTTYFGNAWMAGSYWRNFSEIGTNENCSEASAYYEKAMLLTQNKELGAKCCFMAAKCEHNKFYVNEKQSSWDLVSLPNNYYSYQTFFKMLKEKYSETGYYKEVIAECSYFRQYLELVHK